MEWTKMCLVLVWWAVCVIVGSAVVSSATTCVDSPVCDRLAEVCNGDDQTLVESLCPVKCGYCGGGGAGVSTSTQQTPQTAECADSPSLNCSTLAHDVCAADVGFFVCRKTCGLCGEAQGQRVCSDEVVDIQCRDLPNPCLGDLGKIACPKYCQLCPSPTLVDTTTPAVTTLPTTPTPITTTTKQPISTSAATAATTTATTATTATPTSQSASSPCSMSPCLNDGTCTPQGASDFTCQCRHLYTGPFCTQGGPCTSSPCQNGGTCVNDVTSPGRFTCTCPVGVSGATCDHIITTTPTTTTTSTTSTTTSTTSTTSTTTTTKPTTTTPHKCVTLDKTDIGCDTMEVVFLLEHSHIDTGSSIDHEGDFVSQVIDTWHIRQKQIRVSVVAYNNSVQELSPLTMFPITLKQLVNNHTDRFGGLLTASGDADLAKALDFTRLHSFSTARPDVPKVVIAVVHQMPSRAARLQEIAAAGRRLRSDCVSVVAVVVDHPSIDYPTVKNTVSEDYLDHYWGFKTFRDLDAAGKSVFNCPQRGQ